MLKNTANGKTAMPEKMGEGNQRDTHEIWYKRRKEDTCMGVLF